MDASTCVAPMPLTPSVPSWLVYVCVRPSYCSVSVSVPTSLYVHLFLGGSLLPEEIMICHTITHVHLQHIIISDWCVFSLMCVRFTFTRVCAPTVCALKVANELV